MAHDIFQGSQGNPCLSKLAHDRFEGSSRRGVSPHRTLGSSQGHTGAQGAGLGMGQAHRRRTHSTQSQSQSPPQSQSQSQSPSEMAATTGQRHHRPRGHGRSHSTVLSCLLIPALMAALLTSLPGGTAVTVQGADLSVPTVYQEAGASQELISDRLSEATGPPTAVPGAKTAARAAAATATAAAAPAATVKQLIPASAVISLCLQQAGGSLTIAASNAQTGAWEGWGTSLAWFAYYIGSFPNDQLNLLLDLLFDPNKGLGLNIVRYNIGGGYNASISTQFTNATDPYRFRGMPGFQPSPGAPYNWSSDAEQRKVLLGARDRGADTFVAFSNSAPWFMTVSGDVAGAASPTQCNLRADCFQAFAEYLTDVVLQYKTDPDWNLEFQYLEPFNEPLEGFWMKGKKHEGCFFNPRQISALASRVQGCIKKKRLSAVMVGVDSAAGQTVTGLKYMSPQARKSLRSLHTHGYVYGNAADQAVAVAKAYVPMANAGRAVGKSIWQSEWGPVGCVGADEDVALCMARHIIESLYLMNARAWVYWQAIDLFPFWSLINIPWDVNQPFSYSFSKKYIIMKQFSRGVPPGSTLLSIPGGDACKHSAAAFYDQRSSRLVLFILNELQTNQTITLNIEGFVPTLTARPSIRPFVTTTTADADFSVVDLKRRMTLTSFTYTFPARSLTRVNFLNVAMAPS